MTTTLAAPDITPTECPSPDPTDVGSTRSSLAAQFANRKWAAISTVALLVVGLAYMFFWAPLVQHVSAWATPGDVWEVFRGAHYVGWGFLGGVYDPSSQIIAFPGMEVLLAPVAILTGRLGLTESYSPFFLSHPSAALVLQPVELLLSGTVIFAVDALSERLRVARGRRICVCVVAAIVVFPVAAIWGHAEDALAMAFAIYALIAMSDRKWRKCGWLLGCGIAIQPLVLLILPLLIGASPAGRRMMLAFRSMALSVVLVGIAFLGDPADTYRAVVKQPAFPTVNHVTPWLALAPKLAASFTTKSTALSLRMHSGHFAVSNVTVPVQQVVVVTGGLGRSLYMGVAVLVGIYVWRRPQSWSMLLWLAATVLAARCFFEAVICPYYLAAPLFVALVLAARMGNRRFGGAVAIAFGTSIYAYFHFSPWVWWLPVVAGLAAVLALAYPVHSASDLDVGFDESELMSEAHLPLQRPPGVLAAG